VPNLHRKTCTDPESALKPDLELYKILKKDQSALSLITVLKKLDSQLWYLSEHLVSLILVIF